MQKITPTSTVASAATSGAIMAPEVRKKTELENKKMEIAFKVYKLNDPPLNFVEKHYLNIKNIC